MIEHFWQAFVCASIAAGIAFIALVISLILWGIVGVAREIRNPSPRQPRSGKSILTTKGEDQ